MFAIFRLNELVWSPWHPELEVIMNDVSANLMFDTSHAFNSSNDMSLFLQSELNMITVIAGIQFDDHITGDALLPSNMHFALRYLLTLQVMKFVNYTIRSPMLKFMLWWLLRIFNEIVFV